MFGTWTDIKFWVRNFGNENVVRQLQGHCGKNYNRYRGIQKVQIIGTLIVTNFAVES